MYCTIQEAWPNIEPINPINNQPIIESLEDNDIKDYLAWKQLKDAGLTIPNESLEPLETLAQECITTLNHFNKCEKCKNYYKKINKNILYDLNNILNNLNVNLIDKNNKELIVMFLVGMLLILIFHLFS